MKKMFYLLIFTLACLLFSNSRANDIVFDPLEVDHISATVDVNNVINVPFSDQIILTTINPIEAKAELIFPNPVYSDIQSSEYALLNSDMQGMTLCSYNLNDDQLRQNLNDPAQDNRKYPVNDQWINRMSLTRLSTGLY